MGTDKLKELKIKEIQALAKEKGIKSVTKYKKNELIALIESAQIKEKSAEHNNTEKKQQRPRRNPAANENKVAEENIKENIKENIFPDIGTVSKNFFKLSNI